MWGAHKRIAFVKPGRRPGVASIWTMRSDGGDQRRITSGAEDRRPEWAPDGRTIAFMRDDDIFLVPASGGEPRNVTGGAGMHVDPAFSPDGRRLAYVTWNDDGIGRLTIVQSSNPARTLHTFAECRFYCGAVDWLPALR